MGNKGLLYIAISLMAAFGVAAFLQMSAGPIVMDVKDSDQVAQGGKLYAAHCAACHGTNLEGETPDWRSTKKDGTLPAPPHDETGHTWHHDDKLLFDYTKKGGDVMTPDGFKSAMPAFGDRLSDQEIGDILTFIKSRWPVQIQERQAERSQALR